ncbi:MAG: hypothetical protein JWL88_45 [Parcubacteria group bacterium]|nr:hypothetical protein [Parcubacteria group bacterium]
MKHSLFLSWKGSPLTDAQNVVLRNVAVLFLTRNMKQTSVNFTHLLLEGRLENKGAGLYISTPGTFFHADMGLVRGELWTADFLIPRGSEVIDLDPHMKLFARRGKNPIREIDTKHTQVGEMSLLDEYD